MGYMKMTFNKVELSQDTIEKTRQWFYNNACDCINEAITGEVRVNNLQEYTAWQMQQAREALAGDYDHTFTFMQRAYFLQTGESVALLA
jgi:hypothetical protein